MAEEFDGCECIWSHEWVMRRLLTLIREGQSYCTDSECIDLNAAQRTSNNEPAENFTMITLFFIFAAILYMFQPNTILRSLNDSNKKHDDNQQQPPSSNGGSGGYNNSNNGAPPAIN